MPMYLCYNGPMQTTSSPAKVSLGAATIKTLLQIKPLLPMRVKEWGLSFDGSAAAVPGVVELIETDVAATVTAFVNADISKVDGVADFTTFDQYATLSTSGSGYSASAEGAIAAVRNLDWPQLVAPTNQFIKQFPLGEGPLLLAGKFYRLRVNFPATVNVLCGLKLEA